MYQGPAGHRHHQRHSHVKLVGGDKVGNADQHPGRQGEFGVEVVEQAYQGRQRRRHDDGYDANGQDHHEGGVGQGAAHPLDDGLLLLHVGCQLSKDYLDVSRPLTHADHATEDGREHLGVLPKGIGEGGALLDGLGDLAQDPIQPSSGLPLQQLQSRQNGDTRFSEGSQLARKGNDLLRLGAEDCREDLLKRRCCPTLPERDDTVALRPQALLGHLFRGRLNRAPYLLPGRCKRDVLVSQNTLSSVYVME